MTPMSSTPTLLFLLLTAWTVLLFAHYAAALDSSLTTDTFLDNLEGRNSKDALTIQKRAPFYLGSRYGRSSTRRVNVSPRTDRFFLGSRYGKRSNEFASPVIYDQDTNEATNDIYNMNDKNKSDLNSKNNNDKKASNNNQKVMFCVYSGVKNFYRCNGINDINTILNQVNGKQTDFDETQQSQLQE